MEFIFVALGGAILGILGVMILTTNSKTHGVIEIDHNTKMCKVQITSDELSNHRIKKAIFEVKHDGKISRDEQVL